MLEGTCDDLPSAQMANQNLFDNVRQRVFWHRLRGTVLGLRKTPTGVTHHFWLQLQLTGFSICLGKCHAELRSGSWRFKWFSGAKPLGINAGNVVKVFTALRKRF
jgi:hypothetical protein